MPFDGIDYDRLGLHRQTAVAHNTTSGKGHNPDGRLSGVKHHGSGAVWFDTGPASLPSASPRRKAASAMIAKIPLPLSRHIAAVYRKNSA